MKYNFPYWGPFVTETKIEQELVDILLEKGKESVNLLLFNCFFLVPREDIQLHLGLFG